MKKIVIHSPENIEIIECEKIKDLKDGQVRVETLMGGICGSDLSVYRGKIPYAKYPNTPGHEIIGRIIEVGNNVQLNVGDKVVAFPNNYCGVCEYCKKGMTNICANKKSYGVTIEGFFIEEVVVDSEFIVKIPETIENQYGVLVEPLAVNVHALSKISIKKDDQVAVVGCGTEGLLNIALLKTMNDNITAIDIREDKLVKAKELNKNITTLLPHEIKNEKFDVVIEAAGAKKAIEQAFTIIKPGGNLISLGLTNEASVYPSMFINRSEITIHGSIIYTKKDFEKAISYIKDKKLYLDPIISKVIPFTKYHLAYEDALSGKYVKILLDFNRNK
ncbi:zinc-dependent alcohol dehydrogenase [Crassaminicella profunda]|uniref:zinc-dependent alcohol dehydrogenase n=1 Tax=Crassaminicella profunda TaxID=1286698 RepID=UPI001CA6D38C|nr:alcohol dehydrogenase catalytic domain-containing protein [Crassaminicella profunda]QZY53589.1 alcohol dehydrogenase catalytic domain-containing protein [Crassaminicella profunda]